MMKKICLSIIAAGALFISGCDTIETKTIHISLGGSKGTAAPASVTTAHIAVYEYAYDDDEEQTVPVRLVASKTLSASGSTTLVVPAKMDLYIFLLALDDEDSDAYWFAEAYYYGSETGGGETPRRAPGDMDVVYLSPFSYSMSSGDSYIEAEMLDENGITVTCGLDTTPSLSYNLSFVSSFHIERQTIDGDGDGPYKVIHKKAYKSSGPGYEYLDEFPNGFPNGVYEYVYRVRLYLPAFGIYFFNWGEENFPLGD